MDFAPVIRAAFSCANRNGLVVFGGPTETQGFLAIMTAASVFLANPTNYLVLRDQIDMAVIVGKWPAHTAEIVRALRPHGVIYSDTAPGFSTNATVRIHNTLDGIVYETRRK